MSAPTRSRPHPAVHTAVDPVESAEPDLRRAFRRHAAGVAVVTVPSAAGPVGFTVTSLASVSATPAMLSFNIAHRSSSWAAVRAAGWIGVHLLEAGQEDLAATFARSGADRFAAPTRWFAGREGVPVLTDCAVALVGEVEHRWAAGDHAIVVARVRSVRVGRPAAPLLYHDGAFGRLATG